MRSRRSGTRESGPAKPETTRYLFFCIPRIVRRIYIFDLERSLAVDLDDGVAGSPDKVLHPGGHNGKTSCRHFVACGFIKFFTHTQTKHPGDNGDSFYSWMRMRRDLI